MRQNESFLEAMSVGDILDFSILLFKNNFKQLSIISLIIYAPLTLLSAFFSVDYYYNFLNFLNIFKDPSHYQSSMLTNSYMYRSAISTLIFFLSTILFFTIYAAADAAVSRIIYQDAVYGMKEKAFPSLKEGFRKLGSLFAQRLLLCIILSGLIFVFSILFVVLALAMIPASRSVYGSEFIYVILMILIFIAIFALTIFFIIKLIFGLNVIAIDNGDIGKSFSKSWNLTKGSVFKISIVFLFAFFMYLTITLITSLIPFTLQFLGKNTFTILFISSQFFITLLHPYFWTLITVIYINLKIKKEGLDLELKVDKLLEAQANNEERNTDIE